MKAILLVVLILSLVSFTLGDLYMQNPRGSNDRFNEQNTNRNNANRNFDSQNNAKGGYAVGESSTQAGQPTVKPMYYFEGSLLQLEWTNQHGCGVDSPDTFCEIIIQYMCDNDYKQYNGEAWAMTDGDQTGNGANPPSTGRQEPDAWWDKCQTRQRNVGLWIADRNLNGDTARFTRQNNNGDRHGNECPEERDYYPYWHPSPWKDVAILASTTERCEYYVANSQNQNTKYECECANWATTGCGTGNSCWRYNNQTACQSGTDTNTNTQCQWVGKNHKNLFQPSSAAEEDIGAPDCQPAPFTRPNQNGNGVNGETPNYMWTIPTTDLACGNAAGDCGNCFLRYRYNITPSDFNNLEAWQHSVPNFSGSYWDVDSNFNGDRSILIDGAGNYFENNPTVDVGASGGLALAHNTAQTGRTFQDRSYMFEIRKRPAEYLGKTIYNINVRGKRGNIVQTYPATEYDFVPTNLKIKYGEYVHFQWVGSNNNPQGNDGQGQAGSDRSNLFQFKSLNSNYPLPVGEVTMFSDVSLIRSYATSGYGLGVDENLNTASPYFDGYSAAGNQLLLLQPGYYAYGSTRNNNFTNRTQKGSIFVQEVTSGSKIVKPNEQ